jgi:hypothetical protein
MVHLDAGADQVHVQARGTGEHNEGVAAATLEF